jgi:hypothetical protein
MVKDFEEGDYLVINFFWLSYFYVSFIGFKGFLGSGVLSTLFFVEIFLLEGVRAGYFRVFSLANGTSTTNLKGLTFTGIFVLLSLLRLPYRTFYLGFKCLSKFVPFE